MEDPVQRFLDMLKSNVHSDELSPTGDNKHANDAFAEDSTDAAELAEAFGEDSSEANAAVAEDSSRDKENSTVNLRKQCLFDTQRPCSSATRSKLAYDRKTLVRIAENCGVPHRGVSMDSLCLAIKNKLYEGQLTYQVVNFFLSRPVPGVPTTWAQIKKEEDLLPFVHLLLPIPEDLHRWRYQQGLDLTVASAAALLTHTEALSNFESTLSRLKNYKATDCMINMRLLISSYIFSPTLHKGISRTLCEEHKSEWEYVKNFRTAVQQHITNNYNQVTAESFVSFYKGQQALGFSIDSFDALNYSHCMTLFPVTEEISKKVRLMAAVQPYHTTPKILRIVSQYREVVEPLLYHMKLVLKKWRIDNLRVGSAAKRFQTLQLIGRIYATAYWFDIKDIVNQLEPILQNIRDLYRYPESGVCLIQHVQYVKELMSDRIPVKPVCDEIILDASEEEEEEKEEAAAEEEEEEENTWSVDKFDDCTGLVTGDLTLSKQLYTVVNFLSNPKHKGVIVWHGTGAGKTLTSIVATECLLSVLSKEKKALLPVTVIVPASLKQNYRENVSKFKNHTGKYNIFSYDDALTRPIPCNGILIFDEAHNLKERNGSKSKACLECAKRAFKVILLTATPVINAPTDILPLIAMIPGKKSLSEETFMTMSADQQQRYLMHTVSYFARQEDDPDYPTKQEEIVTLPLTAEQEREYNSALRQKVDAFYTNQKTTLNKVLLFIKLGAVKDLLEHGRFSANGRQYGDGLPGKTLIYTQFIHHGVQLIKEYFPTILTYTGQMTESAKHSAVTKYNQHVGPIALVVTDAGAEGLDLKNTKNVVILDPRWNSAEEEQIIGRAIRYQSHPVGSIVNVYKFYLSFANSPDLQLQVLEKKKKEVLVPFLQLLKNSSI
jgi:superfamily II DNA or RNA helicase